MRDRWPWRAAAAIPLCGVFLTGDPMFFAANLMKIASRVDHTDFWRPCTRGILSFERRAKKEAMDLGCPVDLNKAIYLGSRDQVVRRKSGTPSSSGRRRYSRSCSLTRYEYLTVHSPVTQSSPNRAKRRDLIPQPWNTPAPRPNVKSLLGANALNYFRPCGGDPRSGSHGNCISHAAPAQRGAAFACVRSLLVTLRAASGNN